MCVHACVCVCLVWSFSGNPRQGILDSFKLHNDNNNNNNLRVSMAFKTKVNNKLQQSSKTTLVQSISQTY